MKRFLIIFITGSLLAIASGAQNPPAFHILQGIMIERDTMPHVDLPEIQVYSPKVFRNKTEEQQYWRLVYRVKKVLPYAREAAVLMRKYESEVSPEARSRDRRIYIRQAEAELMQKYGSTLKKMSVNDGRILIKLIDRETEKVSYELIQELKGNLSAVFWQGIARLFGNNLKSHYDPMGEDRQIEQIIQYIDLGLI